MENELVAFLSAYITLTPELTEAIMASGMIQHFKKKTVLLKEGERSNECYFILKGCIRSYYIKDGEEKTTDFFTEGQVVSPSCYGTPRPSDQYLECLEDTIASIGTPDLESEMYAKYPQLETLARVVGEHMLSGYKDTFAEFKMSSPKERYLYLLDKRPQLIQIAPQHQLASYLGIKPESLSRIRRRLGAGK